MSGLFDAIGPLLFAQDAGGQANTWSTILFFLPLPLLFYFMIYLPQKEQEKKRRTMIEALKKNDRVVTAGGIYGAIVSIDSTTGQVVLRIDDEKGVRMKVDRGSIVRVVESE
ncbi:preprotein translocase subunit YajC [Paludisphaera rhizosphaerae]|nr:preprotein translocase subunit YajC [Paludisphaera rhizosphaerae]